MPRPNKAFRRQKINAAIEYKYARTPRKEDQQEQAGRRIR
jgi:hypothetical protein